MDSEMGKCKMKERLSSLRWGRKWGSVKGWACQRKRRGDGRGERGMGDAVGIISKHPLYPAARTEGPVWLCVCVSGCSHALYWVGFAPVCTSFTTTKISIKQSSSGPHMRSWEKDEETSLQLLPLYSCKIIFVFSQIVKKKPSVCLFLNSSLT